MPMTDDKQLESSSVNSAMKRMMMLVGIGYLFFIFSDHRDGILRLGMKFILKDELHLNPEQIASFFAIASMAWYFKPLAGLLTDNFPFLGTKRKAYLVASAIMAGIFWIAISLIPRSYGSMLTLLVLVNIGLVIGQTTLGGMLVQYGQEYKATGQMSSIRNGAENLGALLSALISGWIAAHFLGPGIATAGLLMFVLALFFVKYFREPRTSVPDSGALKATLLQFKKLFTSRTMWIATVFWMLVRFTPGFQTPLFFHQTNHLKLSPEFIGYLTFINAGTALVGSAVYIYLCKKYSLRTLLYFGVTLSVLSAFCYLGYNSVLGAILVESAAGLGTGMAFLAILDLLARSTPKGCEALGYSLIFSFGNISLLMSDVWGSSWFEKLGNSFTPMVWINSGTSALVLLAIPFLPKVLVSHREGHNPEVGSELVHDV
jgi:MFS family permease